MIVVYRQKDATHPTAPASPWETVIASGGWSVLYPRARRARLALYCWLAVDGDSPDMPPAAAGRGVWLVCVEGSRGLSRLKSWASQSPGAWTLRQLRAASTPLANAIKASWPMPIDENGVPVAGPIGVPDICGQPFRTRAEEHADIADVPDGGDE